MVVNNNVFLVALLAFGIFCAEGSYCRELGSQADSNSLAISCKDIINNALSYSERYKESYSASRQQREELYLERMRYHDDVLLKHLSECVTYAAKHSNYAVSKPLFDLAYSYSTSADETFAIEFAKYYLMNKKMAKAMLLEFERDKRRVIIDKIEDGLENLYNKPEELSKLNRLEQRLDQLESQ